MRLTKFGIQIFINATYAIHFLCLCDKKLCHEKEEYEKYHTFLPLMVRSINSQFNLQVLSFKDCCPSLLFWSTGSQTKWRSGR